MKKIVLILILGIFLQNFGYARGEGDAAIEIAVVGPHSGEYAPYGIPTRNAVELVFGDVDNVTINAQDDECKPEVAANVASRIIDTKAVVVIGHICSGAMQAALNVYKQTGLISISPSATNSDLTQSGKHKGLFFRVISPDNKQGETQAQFLVDTLKVKRVAVVHDKGEYGKGLAEYTRQGLKARKVSVELFGGITVGAADYTTIVNKIASLNVDAVTFGGFHPEAAKFITQLRRRGVESPFIGGDGIQNKTFLNLAGNASKRVYATGPKDNASNPLYQKAKQLHIEKYSEEPGSFFYEAYAAALVVKKTFEALQSKGKAITTKTVASYVADSKNSFETSLGTLSFDENGDATGVGFSVYQAKNGKFVKVK